jgi:hypothetical protein
LCVFFLVFMRLGVWGGVGWDGRNDARKLVIPYIASLITTQQ